jgi:hypothetical protein
VNLLDEASDQRTERILTGESTRYGDLRRTEGLPHNFSRQVKREMADKPTVN